MKIKFKNYEVEINAKNTTYCSKEYDYDTLSLLNWISFALNKASLYEKALNYNSIAEDLEDAAEELRKICEENNLY